MSGSPCGAEPLGQRVRTPLEALPLNNGALAGEGGGAAAAAAHCTPGAQRSLPPDEVEEEVVLCDAASALLRCVARCAPLVGCRAEAVAACPSRRCEAHLLQEVNALRVALKDGGETTIRELEERLVDTLEQGTPAPGPLCASSAHR